MSHQTAWLCRAAGQRDLLFFPDFGKYLELTPESLKSFIEDKFFFGRWLPGDWFHSKELPSERDVVAIRSGVEMTVRKSDLFMVILLQLLKRAGAVEEGTFRMASRSSDDCPAVAYKW